MFGSGSYQNIQESARTQPKSKSTIKILKQNDRSQEEVRTINVLQLFDKLKKKSCCQCRELIIPGQGVSLKCFHDYHAKCLETILKIQLQKSSKIQCESCHSPIKFQQLSKQVNFSFSYLHQQQLQNQLAVIKANYQFSQCLNKDCRYFFVYNPNKSFFSACPNCETKYCYKCQVFVEDFETHIQSCFINKDYLGIYRQLIEEQVCDQQSDSFY